MNKYLVIITGATASGKTTLARKLAEELKTGYLSVDRFVEQEWDKTGFESALDREFGRSRAKLNFLVTVKKYIKENRPVIIVEHPFHPQWVTYFKTIQDESNYKIIYVKCNSVSKEEITKRIKERVKDTRLQHPAHFAHYYRKYEDNSWVAQYDDDWEQWAIDNAIEELDQKWETMYNNFDYSFQDTEYDKLVELLKEG